MILLKKQKKYAWINVKVCMLVLFVNGMVMQTYGIFIPHMRDDFGNRYGECFTCSNCFKCSDGTVWTNCCKACGKMEDEKSFACGIIRVRRYL